MGNLTEKMYALREQVSSLAQDCLDADQIEAFQDLNRIIVDITGVARRLSGGDVSSTPENSVESTALDPPSGPLPIFRLYKGLRYEATLDPQRIQPDGRGKCVCFEGQWLAASGSASQITSTAVDGWVNFWRFRDSSGVERPIDDIRKTKTVNRPYRLR